MVPQTDLVRVQRWVDARNERIADSARDLIRNDIDVTDQSITIVCRVVESVLRHRETT